MNRLAYGIGSLMLACLVVSCTSTKESDPEGILPAKIAVAGHDRLTAVTLLKARSVTNAVLNEADMAILNSIKSVVTNSSSSKAFLDAAYVKYFALLNRNQLHKETIQLARTLREVSVKEVDRRAYYAQEAASFKAMGDAEGCARLMQEQLSDKLGGGAVEVYSSDIYYWSVSSSKRNVVDYASKAIEHGVQKAVMWKWVALQSYENWQELIDFSLEVLDSPQITNSIRQEVANQSWHQIGKIKNTLPEGSDIGDDVVVLMDKIISDPVLLKATKLVKPGELELVRGLVLIWANKRQEAVAFAIENAKILASFKPFPQVLVNTLLVAKDYQSAMALSSTFMPYDALWMNDVALRAGIKVGDSDTVVRAIETLPSLTTNHIDNALFKYSNALDIMLTNSSPEVCMAVFSADVKSSALAMRKVKLLLQINRTSDAVDYMVEMEGKISQNAWIQALMLSDKYCIEKKDMVGCSSIFDTVIKSKDKKAVETIALYNVSKLKTDRVLSAMGRKVVDSGYLSKDLGYFMMFADYDPMALADRYCWTIEWLEHDPDFNTHYFLSSIPAIASCLSAAGDDALEKTFWDKYAQTATLDSLRDFCEGDRGLLRIVNRGFDAELSYRLRTKNTDRVVSICGMAQNLSDGGLMRGHDAIITKAAKSLHDYGENDKAEYLAKTVLVGQPSDSTVFAAYDVLLRVAMSRGTPENAKLIYDDAMASCKSQDVANNIFASYADVMHTAGQWGNIVSVSEELLNAGTNMVDPVLVNFYVMEAYRRLGRFDQAVKSADQILSIRGGVREDIMVQAFNSRIEAIMEGRKTTQTKVKAGVWKSLWRNIF